MSTKGNLITTLFSAMETHRSRIAISDCTGQLSYQALTDSIFLVKKYLESQGIKPGERLLLVGQKSQNFLIAMLACLISNIVYIPIEEPVPEERIRTIVLQTSARGRLNIGGELERYNHNTLNISHEEDVLVFYTSGSSGSPKAVRIHATSILLFANWVKTTFHVTENDRFCAFAPWHFDLSIADIYAALFAGASIHCVPAGVKSFPLTMTTWLANNNITVMYMVPTALRHLLKHTSWNNITHISLRCILFAGEIFALPELIQLREAFPTVMLANLYGPTETNVCTWMNIPEKDALMQWQEVPIGFSLPYFDTFIVNGKEEGELVCRGAAVSPGYLNDPTSTRFYTVGNERAYYTGDWVKATSKGWVFLGRQDRQVKLWGHRVDLAEIESYLRRHQDVNDAAVCVFNKTLVAFISSQSPLKPAILNTYCLNYFPKQFVPAQYLFLDDLPKTASDKIDYQILLNLIQESESEIA